MSQTDTAALQGGNLAKAPDARGMKRIGGSGFTGTLIEFYDLQIYATAAAIVFPATFFPQLGPAAGTVAAFGTLGVAFIARPVGSVLFGHFGDRLGRKKTLVTTLFIMGVSTLLVGLLPSGEQIGIAAPIILIVLRILQGLAAGGEWAGAALFVAENAPPAKRGIWSMLPSLGGALALSLAGLTFVATNLTMSEADFLGWGWRIPFLASVVLLAIGMYIRLKTEETPVFKAEVKATGTSTAPFLEALKVQPKHVILGCLVEVPAFALLYVTLTHMVSFGRESLDLSTLEVLATTVASGLFMSIGIVVTAKISDRTGRRPVLIASSSLAVVWSLLLFPVAEQGTLLSYAVSVVVTTLIVGFILGPVGALMSELFHTRYRYTAAGLCYNMAGIFGGAVPPLFAGAIVAAYGGFVFGVVLAVLALASVIACILLPETRRVNLVDQTVGTSPLPQTTSA
jgi:MFS family permease